jgi:hypothetical protein
MRNERKKVTEKDDEKDLEFLFQSQEELFLFKNKAEQIRNSFQKALKNENLIFSNVEKNFLSLGVAKIQEWIDKKNFLKDEAQITITFNTEQEPSERLKIWIKDHLKYQYEFTEVRDVDSSYRNQKIPGFITFCL